MEHLIKQLFEASEAKQVCRIILAKEALPRVVHPYGVCQSSANNIILVCWQSAGYSKGGQAGFKNLLLEKIIEIELTNVKFSVKKDFNSKDPQYKDWVYHV